MKLKSERLLPTKPDNQKSMENNIITNGYNKKKMPLKLGYN
jgi:hypothetical protein